MTTGNSPDIRLKTSLGGMTGPFSFWGLLDVSLDVSDPPSVMRVFFLAELSTVSLKERGIGIASCWSTRFVGDGCGIGGGSISIDS